MTTSTLTPAAVTALSGAQIDGQQLTLVGQLDKKTYTEVNRVLERLGGTWNRKAKAHIFDCDPRVALAEVLGEGQMPKMPKTPDEEAAFWRTPPDVVERLLAKAGLFDAQRGVRVLEPSAGDGAIADAVKAEVPSSRLVCVEPDPDRAAILVGKGYDVQVATFEEYTEARHPDAGLFDVVVMNPPFAAAGRPVLWAEHVLLAWDVCLAEGGTLAAVVPNNITRNHRIAKQVKLLVDAHGDFEALPEDSFKMSGTDVRTGIITLWR